MLSVLKASSGELVGFNLDFSTSDDLRALCIHLYEAAATSNHSDFAYEIDPLTGKICIMHQQQGKVIGVQGNVEPVLAPSLLRTLCDQEKFFQLDFNERSFSIIENTHDLDRVGLVEVKDFEVIY